MYGETSKNLAIINRSYISGSGNNDAKWYEILYWNIFAMTEIIWKIAWGHWKYWHSLGNHITSHGSVGEQWLCTAFEFNSDCSWPPCVADADITFSSCRLLWPPYGIGQTIIFLPCGIFLLLSFFLAESQRSQNGCLPCFDTWCGPSANLECRSEMCCTQLARNAGPKKSPKIGHLGTIAQLCRALSSQLRYVSTIRKTLAKQQYLLHMSGMSPQYGKLRPTSGWDRSGSLGHPS